MRRCVAGIGVGHRRAVRAVADVGDLVVSCSDDATIRLWRVEGPALVDSAVISAHSDGVVDFAVLPGDQYLTSASADGVLAFVDMSKAYVVGTAKSEHSRAGITALALHPFGLMAATGSAGRILLWDLRYMEVDENIRGGPNTGSITSIAFNNDGVTMAASTASGQVLIWDLRNVSAPLTPLSFQETTAGNSGATQEAVTKIAFDPFGKYLGVGSTVVSLWNWKERTELNTLSSHLGPVTGIAWGEDARWMVSSSMDKSVRIYS
jgi:pre-mRNA-processing factor 19